MSNATDTEPLDVWLRFDDESEYAEAEANTFPDEDGFRVEWYINTVGQVTSRFFTTREGATAWLEAEGFEDYSS